MPWARVGSTADFLVLASLTTGLVILFYGLPLAVGALVGVVVGLVGVFALRNRERNLQRLKGHPSVFPNPLGGGLLMLYVYRPWMRELSEVRRKVDEKTLKKHFKQANEDAERKARATAARQSYRRRQR